MPFFKFQMEVTLSIKLQIKKDSGSNLTFAMNSPGGLRKAAVCLSSLSPHKEQYGNYNTSLPCEGGLDHSKALYNCLVLVLVLALVLTPPGLGRGC